MNCILTWKFKETMRQLVPVFFASISFVWLSSGIVWLLLTYWLYQRAQRGQSTLIAWGDLLAGGILFLLTIGFFWRTLSGDVYQPADGGDLVSFLYPTYRFAAAQLQQWTLPLWNPHLYGGAPFISDIQAGFLYLPNLILFLVWPTFPYPVMQWLTIGHLYWAGLGMYVLLRTWQWRPRQSLTRGAALFGALAFQFSDPLLIHLGNLNLIAVLSWLPWCLAAYTRGLNQADHRSRRRWIALAATLFAISTYAGHAQSTFYVALAIALYTVGHAIGEAVEKQLRQSLWPMLQSLGLFYLLGALLTAPILLPAFQLTQFTERSTFTYQDTVAFSLAPTQLIGLLTPSFFGRGPALHWSLWSRVETPYAGVATLILALGACLLIDPATRRRLLPWAGLALFGLVTALGIYAVAHGWLTALVPLFGQFRAPARALVLWTFGVSALAALGLDLLATTIPEQVTAAGRHAWQALLNYGTLILLGLVTPLAYLALLLTQDNETAFLRASLAALALTLVTLFWLGTWAIVAMRGQGWLDARWTGVALVGLLFFDLSATGAYTDISPSDPTGGFAHPEIVAFLHAQPDLTRIDSLTDINDLWQPDAAALHALQDVGGIANPLMLADWQSLWGALGGRQTPLYDMLNVGYVLVRDGTPLPEGKFELALDAAGPLAVYRNLTAYPRAWLVHEIQTAETHAQALATLQTATFDPSQQAVLLAAADLPILAPATGPEVVTITGYGSNRIALTIEASAPALLILSENWYPGWQATVNNVPTDVLQVNGALRAIAVPSGTAAVVLRFAPISWRLGLVGWGLGCCVLVAVWLGGRWPRRAKPAPTQEP